MNKTVDFRDHPTKTPPPPTLDPAKLWHIISTNNSLALPLLLQTYRSYFQRGLLPSQNPAKKPRRSKNNENEELTLAGKGSYDYLYHQQWPIFKAPKQSEEDSIIIEGAEIPKEGTREFWKFMERRQMSSVFCEWGFGVEPYHNSLTNKTYMVDQNRLKDILLDVIREAIKLLQEHLNDSSIALPSGSLVGLTPRLLRYENWLPVWGVTVLRNVIKMRYWLGGRAVNKEEAIELMKKCVVVASASKQYSQQYRVQELSKYQVPIRENREEDRLIAASYLQSFDFEEVEKKTGLKEEQALQRLREIVRGVLKKVTCLMELIGVPITERVRNRRVLELIAGSSRCRQMQAVLLEFYLQPSRMDSSGIYQFYKLLREARNLYHLDKLQNGRSAKTPLLHKIEIRKKDEKHEGELRKLYERYVSLKTKIEFSECWQETGSNLSHLSREQMEEEKAEEKSK